MKTPMIISDHISVCICTYKRPQLLSNLLNKLQDQVTENLFTYSVVVVDNDILQSAGETVRQWQSKSTMPIDYYCEPEQNISLARNKAVANAKGNFIAFIDDDEFPESLWLINLLKTQQKYKVAGVLGPVKPYFEIEPPKWIIKGKICERTSFTTGIFLHEPRYTRTGNVLLRKNIFDNQPSPFNPQFGLTGGEDVDFFARMLKNDLTFVWCDEAPVFEIVPPERFTRTYYLKRALMRGFVNSNNLSFLDKETLKSLLAFFLYTLSLPVWALLGHHRFMKYLIKNCDHIGKLLGVIGYKFSPNR